MNPSKAWNTKLEAASFFPSKNLYNQCALFIFWPKSFSSTGIPRLVRFFGHQATALIEKPY